MKILTWSEKRYVVVRGRVFDFCGMIETRNDMAVGGECFWSAALRSG